LRINVPNLVLRGSVSVDQPVCCSSLTRMERNLYMVNSRLFFPCTQMEKMFLNFYILWKRVTREKNLLPISVQNSMAVRVNLSSSMVKRKRSDEFPRWFIPMSEMSTMVTCLSKKANCIWEINSGFMVTNVS